MTSFLKSIDLKNRDNFNLFFKGIYIEAYNFIDPLMMILDLNAAELVINYDYNNYNKNGTDEVIHLSRKRYKKVEQHCHH